MTQIHLDRSYRALLGVPSFGRIIVSMQTARIAQSMVGIAIVLFTLNVYGSPILAGIVTFASVFPGILVSPIAGALLDRHGRVRLITVDYLIALTALVLIGVLSLAGALPPWLLVTITAVSSLTSTLSNTGLRSLFPIIVPKHLWERVNAVDSNGYVFATILGPPIAAALVAFAGGPVALIAIGAAFGVAAVALVGVRDPVTETSSSGGLLRDAWEGLVYTWRNPTLRGLGFSISTLNLAGGMGSIVIPLIVLTRLGLSETAVGLVFAASGVSGMFSAFLWGRMDTRGREWAMLVVPMLLVAPVIALMLPPAGSPQAGTPGAIDPLLGTALVVGSQAIFGILNGPLDIALFTVRQRRTDPAVLGRAFAVSMAFNFMGFPLGAALAGALADVSLTAAVWLGIGAALVSAVFAATLVPREGHPH